MKFIAGVPMKPATNGSPGDHRDPGAPTCCILPSFITTMRSARVMAST